MCKVQYSMNPELSESDFAAQKGHAPGIPALAYQTLNVYGFGTPLDYQKTFINYPLAIGKRLVAKLLHRWQKSKVCILEDFEGALSSGEMLLVLGRPGSGCTTLLKTLAGDNHGLQIDPTALLSYQGKSIDDIHKHSRGNLIYSPESDIHFAQLTVAQTLIFASDARQSTTSRFAQEQSITTNESVEQRAKALGLSQVMKTKVGNSHVKGISGGERKRTSIAEVLVGNVSLQCWDNSTRGLDSANALRFIQCLRSTAATSRTVVVATLYQASEDIYNCFDKVTLLYEGREIFFGSVNAAKSYFIDMGFLSHHRSTTPDFLCSITNPIERKIRTGYEDRVPRTAAEFANAWRSSRLRDPLIAELQSYQQRYQDGQAGLEHVLQRLWTSKLSTYQNTFSAQVRLCVIRGFERLSQDLAPPLSSIFGNALISIILGSMFYNLPDDTSSFFGRSVLLFFTILTNTLLASFEGVQLWDHQPIVEKHFQFAFYRRSAEAVASMLCDLPNKFLLTAGFNLPFYLLANMRRTPAAFFTFYLFAFVSLLTGSMLYRTIGALSHTLTASIAPGSVFILLLVIYTGFVLPIPSMHPWLRWFSYLNPIGYAFESLMINEFDGRQFKCASFVPEGANYLNVGPSQRTCSVTGATPGSDIVHGSSYLDVTYHYDPKHMWRNLGALFAFMTFLCFLYLLAAEALPTLRPRGEVLLFRKKMPLDTQFLDDQEAQKTARVMPHSSQEKPGESSFEQSRRLKSRETKAATFIWDEISYEIKLSKGRTKLLEDVEGWVEPGTLTALMGQSGAGKTTLLNVLANRADVGVISGEKLANTKFHNRAFARKVGYAQQQDIAVPTATVKETLVFNARLRQSSQYTDAEKLAYVDDVLATLGLCGLADAVVGVAGEGLNSEQRKRLTIGIELAARPELLLFLDEPTSGLDSNTAWSICTLLRKLADSGQAILCTIHQPSGTTFEMFDRLLFIQNGQSIYFGNIGPSSQTVVEYFTRNGATQCTSNANPAEWLMTITEPSHDAATTNDWPSIWKSSAERCQVKDLLAKRKAQLRAETSKETGWHDILSTLHHILTSSTTSREEILSEIGARHRIYIPSYFSLLVLVINGFSFYMSANSLQGIQNQIFSVFLLFILHSSLVQLIIPRFLDNRALYELSERPSRAYRWDVFVVSSVISEIPSQTILAIVQFVAWYYPIGMYRNAASTDALHERSGLMFLLMWSYMLFSSSFSQMMATIMPDSATGINISSLLYSLSLIFCGVLVAPSFLPGFWTFMYRATPITYFVSAMVSTGLAGVGIQCTVEELVLLDPPDGQTCGMYLREYLLQFGSSLSNHNAVKGCQVCPVSSTDSLIARFGIYYTDRWRYLGLTIVYSVFNVIGALILYWLFRVQKGARGAI